MPDLCHYETSTDAEFSVACGASASSIKLITEHLPLVTCPLCLNAVAHRATDVRPPVAPSQLRYRKGELGRITDSGGQLKVKFVNEEDETKWLNVTSDEFARIKEVLTDGQD